MSYTAKDGTEYPDYTLADDNAVYTEVALYGNYMQGEDFQKDCNLIREYVSQKGNTTELRNLSMTLKFCEACAFGVAPQFDNKREFFKFRGTMIKEAQIYTIRDEVVKLLIEKNTVQDFGYRPLPRNNMFLEVFFDFGKVVITGIHLIKVFFANVDGDNKQIYAEEGMECPVGFEEGISIFVTGLGSDGVGFYNYFSLEKKQMQNWRKPEFKYLCPSCNLPLEPLSKVEFVCKRKCKLKGHVFDMTNKKIADQFVTQNMKDIWFVEDAIRGFVCNFLDFITNREVEIVPMYSEIELKEHNKKRARRGKTPLPFIRVVHVTGHLRKYVSVIKHEYNSDIERIKREIWVSGHFFRFWDFNRWNKLYANLKGLQTNEERQAKIKTIIRFDTNGHAYPPYQQYEWDSTYNVIKVWKIPFIKNRGCEKDSGIRITVVSK